MTALSFELTANLLQFRIGCLISDAASVLTETSRAWRAQENRGDSP